MSLNKKSVTYPVGNRSVLNVNRKFYGRHGEENTGTQPACSKTRSKDCHDSLYTTNPNLRKSDYSAEKINKLTLRRREKRAQSADAGEALEHRKQVSEKFSYFLHTRPCFSYTFHPDLNPYSKQSETIFNTNLGSTWILNEERTSKDLQESKVVQRNESLSEKRLENQFYIKPLSTQMNVQDAPQRLLKIEKFTTTPDKSVEEKKIQQLRDNLVHHKTISITDDKKTTSYEDRLNESLKRYFPFEPKLRYGRTVTIDTTDNVVPEETSPLYADNKFRLVRKLNDSQTFQNDVKLIL